MVITDSLFPIVAVAVFITALLISLMVTSPSKGLIGNSKVKTKDAPEPESRPVPEARPKPQKKTIKEKEIESLIEYDSVEDIIAERDVLIEIQEKEWEFANDPSLEETKRLKHKLKAVRLGAKINALNRKIDELKGV